MPSIRKVKTGSGSMAIQVVRYEHRKVVVMKHIGSGRDAEEISALIESATAWMMRETGQGSLFGKSSRRTLPLATAQYKGTTYAFAYDVLHTIATRCGFTNLHNPLLIDLCIMRIMEPTSKRQSVVLLERYFGIRYALRSLYRMLPRLKSLKDAVEKIAVTCAQEQIGSDLSLVLYDVTTLYFETFDADELRIAGFSKDNKSQQPQIVIGLLVTRQGFPLGYEVFPGNTFEGKTMIPVLEAFTKAHAVITPTIVADAAMLSRTNMGEIERRGLSYIVGARLANTSPTLIHQISIALEQKDGAHIRVKTDHGDLICAFSAKRFRKNRAEMQAQIAKGEMLIKKGEPGKRAKFVKRAGKKDAYALNKSLIEKTTMLLGIKGYYTNIPEEQFANEQIVERYHDLWNVEQAFRMAKSDLATRPIFHYKEEAVKAHMLICFVALVMGKYMEITTGRSLKHLVDTLTTVTDAHITDSATSESFVLRSPFSQDVHNLIKKLGLSH